MASYMREVKELRRQMAELPQLSNKRDLHANDIVHLPQTPGCHSKPYLLAFDYYKQLCKIDDVHILVVRWNCRSVLMRCRVYPSMGLSVTPYGIMTLKVCIILCKQPSAGGVLHYPTAVCWKASPWQSLAEHKDLMLGGTPSGSPTSTRSLRLGASCIAPPMTPKANLGADSQPGSPQCMQSPTPHLADIPEHGGHALVHVEVSQNAKAEKLVFPSFLGRVPQPLLVEQGAICITSLLDCNTVQPDLCHLV